MKKIFSKTAVTLIELLVALTLLSVIILGIFSINMVLNNNSQDYGQRYLVKSETQATLNHILNNATLAVGANAVASSEGILIGAAQVGDANSFCIHQGPNNNIIKSPNAGYNKDIWLCYSYYGSGAAVTATSAPYEIFYCTMLDNGGTDGGTDPRGATSCHGVGNSQFLGTAYSMTVPVFNSTSGFSVTIQNCLNDAAASCVPDCNYAVVPGCANGGTTSPASNPEVLDSGSIFPPQVSTN